MFQNKYLESWDQKVLLMKNQLINYPVPFEENKWQELKKARITEKDIEAETTRLESLVFKLLNQKTEQSFLTPKEEAFFHWVKKLGVKSDILLSKRKNYFKTLIGFELIKVLSRNKRTSIFSFYESRLRDIFSIVEEQEEKIKSITKEVSFYENEKKRIENAYANLLVIKTNKDSNQGGF